MDSSSKVTVEYRDPSGIFNLVQPLLFSRLPLRNLNWQSGSRPLRQIKRLDIEFVPDRETENDSRPAWQRGGADVRPHNTPGEASSNQGDLQSNSQHENPSHTSSSLDIVRSGTHVQHPPRTTSRSERRHQIPGLKATPYLRIYLLRCDDKESYKSTERSKIRIWLRDQAKTASAAGVGGKKHDASEWMIIHIVIPDTVAASEPRWRAKNSTDNPDQRHSDEIRERPKSSTKWPGKGSRTVFDKLRADFNEPSKSAPDRIAQVRLQKQDVPSDLLPTPAQASNLQETQQERDSAWSDLISKLKSLTLTSFDVRVRQYEQDIAEREAQRSLPGWNFNTFFILKEGLARGLESIGLVEDALAIYDELAAGLEAVLRDDARENAAATASATTFAEFTDDIRQRILASGGDTHGPSNYDADRTDSSTGGIFNKDYRSAIVTSSISVFDFYCYLFIRQKALILRLASSSANRQSNGKSATGTSGEHVEDLVRLSEVARRSLNFIHSSARALRQDLAVGSRNERPQSKSISQSPPPSVSDLSLLVDAWSYIVAEQSLKETEVRNPSLSQAFAANGHSVQIERPLKKPEFLFGAGGNAYPQRSSSLTSGPPQKSQGVERLISPQQSVQLDPNGPLSPPPSRSSSIAPERQIPGFADLCSLRAQLCMTKRQSLVMLGAAKGWKIKKSDQAGANNDLFVGTHPDATNQEGTKSEDDRDRVGTLDSLPSNSDIVLRTEASFQGRFEELSRTCIQLYISGDRPKSAELITKDLALLKYQQRDYAASTDLWRQVLPSYASCGWSLLEANAIDVYTRCLKQLERNEEYMRTILALLAKIAERRREIINNRATGLQAAPETCHNFATKDKLAEAIAVSTKLHEDIVVPLEWYFLETEVEQEVLHCDDNDGFQLKLRLQHLLEAAFKPDAITVRLVSLEDPSLEIRLSATDPPYLTPAETIHVRLTSSEMAFGPFYVDKIEVRLGRLLLEKATHMEPKLDPGSIDLSSLNLGNEDGRQQKDLIYLFPSPDALVADVSVARSIHLDKPRMLEIHITSGSNEVSSAEIRLRPATAGLRLHLADSKREVSRGQDLALSSKPGALFIEHISPRETAVIRIPYSMEHSSQQIAVKLELHYTTASKTYMFHTASTSRHELPLDVDVNDAFCFDILLSSFSIRTATGRPLLVYNMELQESLAYAVHSPPLIGAARPVLHHKSSKITYKIRQKIGQPQAVSKQGSALTLRLKYLQVEELYVGSCKMLLATMMQKSDFRRYERLLSWWFDARVRSTLDHVMLEQAVIFGFASLPNIETCLWHEIITTLPHTVRQPLLSDLQAWHTEHSQVELAVAQEGFATSPREVALSVEVPKVDAVFNTHLILENPYSKELQSDLNILVLGEPIRAEIVLKYTTCWSKPERRTSGKHTVGGRKCLLQVHANSEFWALGGRKRIIFTLEEQELSTEPRKFSVTLVPLRLGRCSLPSVDVSAMNADIDVSSKESANGSTDFTCESFYENAAAFVQVVSRKSRARVHIPELVLPLTLDSESPERSSSAQ
ncbi:hypothetical protein K431DRAFT_283344 [Polychaeton citri CBS 116435]|uniref:TMEM1 family protein n=1 Tax=Polychaeton citri CBS 116435 TaxID=1314669 RepID=A0A9P4QDY8_9PEZI|nr:hypothetical protein K431DRAFT_283344 [Polychaeton citri CBS 116435]